MGTITEFHPSLAAVALNGIEEQLDRIVAVVTAGRLMVERHGGDGNATVAGLFSTVEELATDARNVHYLRGYLERLPAEAPPE